MPVMLPMMPDPTDVVIQGEESRAAIIGLPVESFAPTSMQPLMEIVLGSAPLVSGDQSFAPMMNDGPIPVSRARPLVQDNPRANAVVCNQAGAIIPVMQTRGFIINEFAQATDLFFVTGQTVTGAGVALGSCRVVVYETGRIAETNEPPEQYYSAGNPNPARWKSPSPVVAEAVSDGSGNFTIPVPMNTAYQLTGYLTGAPDLAGITRQDVVPTATTTLIYLRDPTAPDGPSGSAAYRPIGSAVIRRFNN